MAKSAKSHHGSSKTVKQKASATKAKKALRLVKTPKVSTKKAAEAEPKKGVAAKPAPAKPGSPVAKPGSPNAMFARPAMRRGRRPKALAEYQPANNEEEDNKEDIDYRGLEYDTGIRVAKPKDENPFNMERFDDYDEELNFDF